MEAAALVNKELSQEDKMKGLCQGCDKEFELMPEPAGLVIVPIHYNSKDGAICLGSGLEPGIALQLETPVDEFAHH